MTPDELRQKLIAARKERGVGQIALAKAAGISQSSVAHFESGRNYLSGEVIARMAAHLGLELILELVEPEEANVYRFAELVRGINAEDMGRLERIAVAMRQLKEPLMKDVLVATMESAGGVRKAVNPFAK